MLQLVNVGQKSLADYATIATRGLMDEIRRLAEPLAGRRLLHISATAFGGGVAEINYALVPLMKDAGLDVEWRIITGADEFFAVTKAIHNGLQGSPEGLTPASIWPPAIDPLTPKNMALSAEDAAYIVDQFGIDVERPLLTQVSRFDPWKDPLGVIDAYRGVKEEHPEVQLALVGSMAHDDPEGWDYYSRTVAYAGGDPDVYILSNLNNVGSVEVNAFQVHSSAVIQKSIREGFGLTVTEALWKTRPVVASRVGGIVAQIQDGETGWLVDSPEECAKACIEILADPAAARQRALRGKEFVRRNFLMPRLLRDWLVLLNLLDGNDTAGAEVATVASGA